MTKAGDAVHRPLILKHMNMSEEEISKIASTFGIEKESEINIIDTSRGNDVRINAIIDRKYVLRIWSTSFSEKRIAAIARLCERYNSIGVIAPHYHKTKNGKYTCNYGRYTCNLSDYIDLPTEYELGNSVDHESVKKDVLAMIGKFASMFSGVDLMPEMSMWSIIDLAPLDIGIDEKQENLDMLVSALKEAGEDRFAKEISDFNDSTRKRIESVMRSLPRCVIQGDLNSTNILIKNGSFAGLIDFNMSGTEVNINNFCCETNQEVNEDEFISMPTVNFYSKWRSEQESELTQILKFYNLNEEEKTALDYYRKICLISQYPNVLSFISLLKKDKAKTIELLELIINEKHLR